MKLTILFLLLIVGSIFPYGVELGMAKDLKSLQKTNDHFFASFPACRVVLTAQEDKNVFEILHPELGNMFRNEYYLVKTIAKNNNLKITSSDFEIIYAVVDLLKNKGLFVNSGILENIGHKPYQETSFIDFFSKQCGDYARQAGILVNLVCKYLERDSILVRYVSLDGHQVLEYFDTDHDKWIFVDADPGTTVLFVAGKPFLASINEIKDSPDLIFSEETITNFERNQIHHFQTLEDAQHDFFKFFAPVLSSIKNYEIEEVQDPREYIFRLPRGTEMVFDHHEDMDVFFMDSLAIGGERIRLCANAFKKGDTALIRSCIQGTADINSITFKEAELAILERRVALHKEHLWNTGRFGWYYSVILPPGQYDTSSLYLPHFLRSIEIEGDETFVLNGIEYETYSLRRAYGLSGVNGGQLEHLKSLKASNRITLTFFANQQMFQFWKKEMEIVVRNGQVGVEVNQISNKEFVENEKKSIIN